MIHRCARRPRGRGRDHGVSSRHGTTREPQPTALPQPTASTAGVGRLAAPLPPRRVCAKTEGERGRSAMVAATSATKTSATQVPLPRKELRGVVERITYQNPENGYTVARLAPERAADAAHGQGDERLVTVVGTLPDLQPSEAIEAKGW